MTRVGKKEKGAGAGFKNKIAEKHLQDVKDLRSHIKDTDGPSSSSTPASRRLTMDEQAKLMVVRVKDDRHPTTGDKLPSQKGRKAPEVVVVLETASGKRIFGQSGNFSVVRDKDGKPMDKRLDVPDVEPRKLPYKHAGSTKVTLDPAINPDISFETARRVSHGKCAEQDALDQAAVLGEDVKDGKILAYNVKTGLPMAACVSCRGTLAMHGLEDIAPGTHES